MEKPIQQKQKVGIVTSLNDTTLTKVTYGKYATRVPDDVAYGIYEWFSSQLNTLLHIITWNIPRVTGFFSAYTYAFRRVCKQIFLQKIFSYKISAGIRSRRTMGRSGVVIPSNHISGCIFHVMV